MRGDLSSLQPAQLNSSGEPVGAGTARVANCQMGTSGPAALACNGRPVSVASYR